MKRPEMYESLDEKELERLKELGLSGCKSASECYEIISQMRMRQLDQTKLMLSRIASSSDLFSEEMKLGIVRNDLGAFARAVGVLLFREGSRPATSLHNALAEKHN
ncbi:MAG: hypothetical protein M1378_12975 [Bacteroidetes bacterium]|nr:hypothetical protein [Bacteroidota bacterium]